MRDKIWLLIVLFLAIGTVSAQVLEISHTDDSIAVDSDDGDGDLYSEEVSNCVEYFSTKHKLKWEPYSGSIKYKNCLKGKIKFEINSHIIQMYEAKNYIIIYTFHKGDLAYIKISRELIKKLKVNKL